MMIENRKLAEESLSLFPDLTKLSLVSLTRNNTHRKNNNLPHTNIYIYMYNPIIKLFMFYVARMTYHQMINSTVLQYRKSTKIVIHRKKIQLYSCYFFVPCGHIFLLSGTSPTILNRPSVYWTLILPHMKSIFV